MVLVMWVGPSVLLKLCIWSGRLGLTSFLNGTASSVTVVWAGPSRLLVSFTLAGILPSLNNGIPVVVGCSVSVPSVTTSTVVSLVRRLTGTA